ncbi:MAG: hypothetical protein ACRD6R_12295 [Candidatus Polarisedimenticolia bacterium]
MPDPAPGKFGLYYSGGPCSYTEVDRTYSQFQVNLGESPVLIEGRLVAGPDGEAVLLRPDGGTLRLLTNASRADWLLTYPLMRDGVAAWGREILRPDCSVADDAIYVEALFPPPVVQGPIPPALDVSRRRDFGGLLGALREYRATLLHSAAGGLTTLARLGEGGDEDLEVRRGSVADLERELFIQGIASDEAPWRARLLGDDGAVPYGTSVDILVSGSDGSVGVFGHIAVGGDGMVYNVYPLGSERGAPEPVSLHDYLFNVQRGHVLRRPTWILRLQGLPREAVAAFHADVQEEIRDIREGRVAYHPTANNCTTVSMRALSKIGFDEPTGRPFTRRFPRPAFTWILSRLPRLIAGGKVVPRRIELLYVPQVPVRLTEGGAPNRPLRDRGRVPMAEEGPEMPYDTSSAARVSGRF